jgi:hypothetical protein
VTKCHDSATGSPAAAGEPSAACSDAGSKRLGVDEVRERSLAVDLDDRQELPVPQLELAVATDVDDLEIEVELGLDAAHDLEGALAQLAVGGAVELDGLYG